MPTTLVTESWASLANWFGTIGSVAGGVFDASAEGMRVCKTPLTSGDLWFRVVIHNNSGVAHVLVISSNGSGGTCLGAAITTGVNPIHIGYLDRYNTFTSWQGDSNADTNKASPGVNFSADMIVGVTYERATKKIRIWAHATTLGAQPDSVTSWDGVTAVAGQTWDFSAVGGIYTDQGNFCGLGADSTGTVQWGAFTAGDFTGGAAAPPVDPPKLPNPMRPFNGIIGKVALALRTLRPPAQTAPDATTVTATGIAASPSTASGAGTATATATGTALGVATDLGQGAALASTAGASRSDSTARGSSSAAGSSAGASTSASTSTAPGAATAAGAGASLSQATAAGTSSSAVTATGLGSSAGLGTAMGAGSAIASASGSSASPARAAGTGTSIASTVGASLAVSLASGAAAAFASAVGLATSRAGSVGVGAATAVAIGICLAISRAFGAAGQGGTLPFPVDAAELELTADDGHLTVVADNGLLSLVANDGNLSLTTTLGRLWLTPDQ